MRFHPDDHQPGCSPGGGGVGGGQAGGRASSGPCRLNLLLSYAGWQTDPWVDRLPRLLEPMGIVSHRASTGREAGSVIATIPIHIAVVDLGLPIDRMNDDVEVGEFDEGGTRLLELLSRMQEPPPVVAVTRPRSQRDGRREVAEALRLGVFAVVDRPRELHDINLMLEVLRRCLDKRYHGRWPVR